MKKKITAVIGMVVCFMMMATSALAQTNGTFIADNLVWLENANCFGKEIWQYAKSRVANLKSGDCGLKDGSTAGQWRLPTSQELLAIKRKMPVGNIQADYYWSSEKLEFVTDSLGCVATAVSMQTGAATPSSCYNKFYVWPVRNR